MASGLVWRGDSVRKKMKKAQKAALKTTAERLRDEAKLRVAVDSGELDESIELQQKEAFEDGQGFAIQVGSNKPEIGYAAIQELGPEDAGRNYTFTPYLIPAMDIIKEAKVLQRQIKAEFENGE
jgi:Bacteriophage HK97-gp10, putative tail-component